VIKGVRAGPGPDSGGPRRDRLVRRGRPVSGADTGVGYSRDMETPTSTPLPPGVEGVAITRDGTVHVWPAARELPCCGAMTPHESCACNASWVPVVTRCLLP